MASDMFDKVLDGAMHARHLPTSYGVRAGGLDHLDRHLRDDRFRPKATRISLASGYEDADHGDLNQQHFAPRTVYGAPQEQSASGVDRRPQMRRIG